MVILKKRAGLPTQKAGVCALVLFIALIMPGCAGTHAGTENQGNGKSMSKPQEPAVSASKTSESAASASSASSATPAAGPASSAQADSQLSPKTGNGHIVCIDPGHQEKVDLSQEPVAPGATQTKYKNPGGAVGVKTGIPEYALNLTVALKLRSRLEALGYTVVMTRTDNAADISNIDRAQIANNAHAELFVRIHADSTDSSAVTGATVLIPGNQYISDANLLSRSRQAGQCLLDGIIASTGAKNRGLSVRSDMTGFNWCKVPMALVEMGFMSNPDEDVRLNSDAYQEKLADGLVNGINAYFHEK